MRKVAGYGRVSTQLQADGTGPNEQLQSITEKCQREGYELVNFYSDVAFSGSDDKRPGLQQLLQDARLNKFQLVMFTKLDRLGRNLRDIKNILNDIAVEGVKFLCVQQPEISNDGIYGNLQLNILGAFAEFERSMIRDRTNSGRMIRWKEGKGTIGSLPFGYKRDSDGIAIDPEKAEIYRKIVTMYLEENYSMRDIALKLTAQGIYCPSGGSKKWYNVTISDILKNPTYMGEGVQNRFKFVKKISKVKKRQYYCVSKVEKPEEEWILIKFPQLITMERFNQIQARIENQKRKPKKHHKGFEDRFIAENVLFCGYCGARIKKRVTAIENFFYCCYWWEASDKERKVQQHPKCILKPMDADRIDTDVFYEIVDVISNPGEYAKNWLRNVDIDVLKERVDILQTRMTEIKYQLTEGFEYIKKTFDQDLKKIYQERMKIDEDDYRFYQGSLEKAKDDLSFAQHKYDRLDEFNKAINGPKVKKIRTLLDAKSDISNYLCRLPFTEKKRIVEAVIAPANGGKINLRYGTKEEEREGEIVLDMAFDLDLNRIEHIINSLNKKGLLNKVGS